MRYEYLKATKLWVTTSCCFAGEYQRFDGNCYFHHQFSFNPEDGDSRFSEIWVPAVPTVLHRIIIQKTAI
jgi:hypothetical protein